MIMKSAIFVGSLGQQTKLNTTIHWFQLIIQVQKLIGVLHAPIVSWKISKLPIMRIAQYVVCSTNNTMITGNVSRSFNVNTVLLVIVVSLQEASFLKDGGLFFV